MEQLEIETYPDDCASIWPWLKAPQWARELFHDERRFILFVPHALPDAAISSLGIPDVLGGRTDAVKAETGDGSLLVAYG